jgi:hypothetical protein
VESVLIGEWSSGAREMSGLVCGEWGVCGGGVKNRTVVGGVGVLVGVFGCVVCVFGGGVKN